MNQQFDIPPIRTSSSIYYMERAYVKFIFDNFLQKKKKAPNPIRKILYYYFNVDLDLIQLDDIKEITNNNKGLFKRDPILYYFLMIDIIKNIDISVNNHFIENSNYKTELVELWNFNLKLLIDLYNNKNLNTDKLLTVPYNLDLIKRETNEIYKEMEKSFNLDYLLKFYRLDYSSQEKSILNKEILEHLYIIPDKLFSFLKEGIKENYITKDLNIEICINYLRYLFTLPMLNEDLTPKTEYPNIDHYDNLDLMILNWFSYNHYKDSPINKTIEMIVIEIMVKGYKISKNNFLSYYKEIEVLSKNFSNLKLKNKDNIKTLIEFTSLFKNIINNKDIDDKDYKNIYYMIKKYNKSQVAFNEYTKELNFLFNSESKSYNSAHSITMDLLRKNLRRKNFKIRNSSNKKYDEYKKKNNLEITIEEYKERIKTDKAKKFLEGLSSKSTMLVVLYANMVSSLNQENFDLSYEKERCNKERLTFSEELNKESEKNNLEITDIEKYSSYIRNQFQEDIELLQREIDKINLNLIKKEMENPIEDNKHLQRYNRNIQYLINETRNDFQNIKNKLDSNKEYIDSKTKDDIKRLENDIKKIYIKYFSNIGTT